jgi:hypothetical protein
MRLIDSSVQLSVICLLCPLDAQPPQFLTTGEKIVICAGYIMAIVCHGVGR